MGSFPERIGLFNPCLLLQWTGTRRRRTLLAHLPLWREESTPTDYFSERKKEKEEEEKRCIDWAQIDFISRDYRRRDKRSS